MQDPEAAIGRLLKPGSQRSDPLGLVSHAYSGVLLLQTDAEFVETLHVTLQSLRLVPSQSAFEQIDTMQQRPGIRTGEFGSG